MVVAFVGFVAVVGSVATVVTVEARSQNYKKSDPKLSRFIFEIYGARTRGLHRDRVA